MTEPIKYWNAPRGTTMHTCADGEWVSASDYARLEQECERLSNELNNMRISWGLMQSEREAALKQVEGLRGDLRFLAEYITAESAGNPLPTGYRALPCRRCARCPERQAMILRPLEGKTGTGP